MKIGHRTIKKLVERFETLISNADDILRNGTKIPAKYNTPTFDPPYVSRAAYLRLDRAKFVEWQTKATTLLALVFSKDHIHYSCVEEMAKIHAAEDKLEWGISKLKAVKDDLEKGFLDDIFYKIEAEISSDYMSLAENLLKEGRPGHCDHIPAAVLGGAVLEKALRALCGQQTPPVSLMTDDGEKKMMDALISGLKKSKLFDEPKAQQLRAWAAIRNKAAHGEFDQFDKDEVEAMLSGIKSFLVDYLA